MAWSLKAARNWAIRRPANVRVRSVAAGWNGMLSSRGLVREHGGGRTVTIVQVRPVSYGSLTLRRANLVRSGLACWLDDGPLCPSGGLSQRDARGRVLPDVVQQTIPRVVSDR